MKFYYTSKTVLKIFITLIIFSGSFNFAQVKGGRWTFENNANDEASWDEVQNDGLLAGTASFQNIAPLVQGSYYLSVEDSGDYGAITITDHNELDFQDENFAVSLWTYPIEGYDEPQYFFMKGDRSGAVKENNYALRTKDEYVEFIVHSESGAKKIGRSSFKVVKNKWNFIAVFYDYDNSTLYLWNDQETTAIDTLDFDAPLFPNDIKLFIGTSGVDGYKRFWGRIDDLRISNNISDILYNSTSINLINNNIEPSKFILNQNYPNPFNPVTTIKFSLSEKNHTKLDVYNVIGEHISSLVNKELLEGGHEIKFDASNLPSGIYFYKLEQGNKSNLKKMILLK